MFRSRSPIILAVPFDIKDLNQDNVNTNVYTEIPGPNSGCSLSIMAMAMAVIRNISPSRGYLVHFYEIGWERTNLVHSTDTSWISCLTSDIGDIPGCGMAFFVMMSLGRGCPVSGRWIIMMSPEVGLVFGVMSPSLPGRVVGHGRFEPHINIFPNFDPFSKKTTIVTKQFTLNPLLYKKLPWPQILVKNFLNPRIGPRTALLPYRLRGFRKFLAKKLG